MNLRAIAASVVSIVNPPRIGRVLVSTGYATLSDGKREPTYQIYENVKMDVQELSERDILQMQGMNIGGSTHTVYLSGRVDGLVRSDNKGGDVLEFDNKSWLVTAVLENWRDYTKAAVTLQGDL